MDVTNLLTPEVRAQAINLAMAIDTGTIDYDYVLDILNSSDKIGTSTLIIFLYRFNDMTRSAIDKLVEYAKARNLENDRKYLENCLSL